MRLDIYITQNYNIQSRNKANELIKAKKIKVNGDIITKASFKILSDDVKIEILEDDFYVSRSAYKLKYFIEELSDKILIKDKIALDIGSSTGGFTQILLENNIKSVDCVDVGSDQLHENIKHDDRISMYEKTDVRIFDSLKIYDIVTCDVSFISIHNILNDINRLASKDIIILFKPQYEVGAKVKRDRAGVVQDQKAIKTARDKFILTTTYLKWKLVYSSQSQVEGKNGNLEELFYFEK
ncbi:MAG: TlyA family RNA methyltransferase [Campylobacteraceae bacterium]|nr:TlyA family RNA methyltransferase [Campylobacteraceae bacterium]